jgi:hypothetical protein
MSNEITTQSMELQLTKQEVEILKLKFELQKAQIQKVSRLEDSLFSPTLFSHYQKVAEILSKSGIVPKDYKGKPEDVFVAISMGYQLGFPVEQSLQDIAVINGRPCLWGDGLLALVLNHPQYEWHTEEPIYTGQVVTGYICTIKRKGNESHSQSFTFDDAKRAGLLNKAGPWSNYPTRMLQMRARAFALRDKFGDALRGLKVMEEEEGGEIIEGEIIRIEEKSKNNVDKLKNILKNSPQLSEKKEEPSTNEKELVSQQQFEELDEMIKRKGMDEERINKMFAYFKINYLTDLTQNQFKEVKIHLGRIV